MTAQEVTKLVLFLSVVVGLGIVIFNNLIQATYSLSEDSMYIFFLLISVLVAIFYSIIEVKLRNVQKVSKTL